MASLGPETFAFTAPFPTLLRLPETSSQPRVGLENTVFSRGRVNSRRSSRFGICPKIVLSGFSHQGDFSARYKSLKVLNEYCPKGEQVGNIVGAASGTEKRTRGRPPVRIPGPPRVHPFKLTNALLEFGNTFWFPSDVPPAIGANIQRKAQYLSSCSRTREVCRKHSSAHPAGIKADENIRERLARTAFVGYLRQGKANMPGLLNQTRRVNRHGNHGQDACVVHNPASQNVTHSRFFADFDVFFS